MSRKRSELLLAGLLACAVLAGLLPYLSTRMPYAQDVPAIVREDEGTILCDSRRIADGQVMYKDFFAFQTPGSYYFLGLSMKAGGRTIRCARFATLLTVALTAALLFLIGAEQLRSRWLAAALALLYPFALFPFWPFAFPYWHCMLFVVAALGLLLWYVERGGRWVLAASGCAAGLALLTIQSSGLLVFAAEGGFLALRAIALRGRDWRGAARLIGRDLAMVSAGFLAPCLLCYGYFAAHGVLGTMLYDNWVWPFTNYRGVYNQTIYGQNLARVLRDFKLRADRPIFPPDADLHTYYQILSLHLGTLGGAALAVVGALYVIGAMAADGVQALRAKAVRPVRSFSGEDAGLAVCACFALALVLPLFAGVTRKDTSHVAFLSLPAWIFLFRLISPRGAPGAPPPEPPAHGRRIAAVLLAGWVASAVVLHARRAYWAAARGGLGLGDLAATEAEVAQKMGGAMIDFLVPPGQTIVWANYGGWPTFTSHRDEAIPFTLLVPPPMHDLGQWREAARAIERLRPPFLVSEDERRHVALLSSVSPFIRARYFFLGELRPGSDLYAYDGGPAAPAENLAGAWQLHAGGRDGTLALQAQGGRLEGTFASRIGGVQHVSGAVVPGPRGPRVELALSEPGGIAMFIGTVEAGGRAMAGEARRFADVRPERWSAAR